MRTAIFKNVLNCPICVGKDGPIPPQSTFLASTDDPYVRYMLSRGILKHMKEFDTVETKEARSEVLNKDIWDMI